MNKVVGRVLLQDNGIGIPDLVVTVYHVHPDSVPQATVASPRSTLLHSWDQLDGARLGSVVTGTDGAFVLEYDESVLGEDRPALLLFVTAPERAGPDASSPMLHVSCGIRQNAGRLESYLISLTAEDLRAAAISPPVGAAPAQPANRQIAHRLIDLDTRAAVARSALAKVRAAWQDGDQAAPSIANLYREKVSAIRQARPDSMVPANGLRLAVPLSMPDELAPVRLCLQEQDGGFGDTFRKRLVRARQQPAS